MKYDIYNNSSNNLDFEDMIHSLVGFGQERFGFKNPPSLHFDSDSNNASNVLGKTGYYDPETFEIHIFVDGRHPKDMLRSIAHELVHHTQNEQGSLANNGYAGEGYAQKNPHLRKMEREAYEKGNMCFRDWEDSYKSTNYRQRSENMSLKEWKNKELNRKLLKRFGIKSNLQENCPMMPPEPEVCPPPVDHVHHDGCGCPDNEIIMRETDQPEENPFKTKDEPESGDEVLEEEVEELEEGSGDRNDDGREQGHGNQRQGASSSGKPGVNLEEKVYRAVMKILKGK